MNNLSQLLFHLKYLAVATVNVGNATYNTDLPNVNTVGKSGTNDVQTILQIVFGAIGAITLIIILIAAMQFITSSGEPQEAARARSTLIYAAIGLILALSAEVIVTYILTNV